MTTMWTIWSKEGPTQPVDSTEARQIVEHEQAQGRLDVHAISPDGGIIDPLKETSQQER